MKKLKKKKHKLALGAYLEENQEPLAKGAMLAGQIVQASGQPTNKTTSASGMALSRAGQGAQLGATFGPYGAAIGAVGGAIEGGIEGTIAAKTAKDRIVNQNANTEALVTKQLMNNSKNAIARGGRLASKLGVIQGGELNQISPDAVEVKANNPGRTDSVELQDAYVDHDEVIDNKNRVFSDELGFAKYAKKLEKQKNDHPRFSAANQHIESKLDDLFQTQEQTKEGMKYGAKTKKAKGGYLALTGPFPMKTTTKAGFVKGGISNMTVDDNIFDKEGNFAGASSNVDNDNGPQTRKRNKFDLNKGLTALSTFGPNIVSSMAQNRLQGPVTPQLEKTVALQRINPNAQLAETDREANQANQLIHNNTAQGSDIASATGNILAKKFANKNAIYGQNQQLNAGIQAQEAGMNTQIGARNVERINTVNQGQADFSNLKQKLTTENIANLSNKLLQQGREQNQMQLDKDRASYSALGFKDSGVQERGLGFIKQNDPEQYARLKSQGFAYGGKLSNREICDEGQLEGILGLYSHPEPHNHFHFENNEQQNLQARKERSKGGKASHKLAKGGYVGGGETPNDPKTTPQKVSANDFQRVSWKSQGVQDSTGRGSMYQTTYGALNKLNNTPIPKGVNPNSQTFVTNPLGLNRLSAPVQPAYDISGAAAPQAGRLAHFAEGGMMGLDESLGDPRHIKQASKVGLSKGGIHIKKSHRGLLHKNLGVKAGHKIPASKLAVHSGDSAALKKRKVFAQNAKKWHHEMGGHLGARKAYLERIF